jgi:uncharacterized membrane protein YdbT with pleckstrin-like domain
MSYAESLLAKNERVLYRARQHWLAPLSDARNGVLLVLAAVVLAFLNLFFLHLGGTFDGVWWLITLVLFVVGAVWVGIVYFTWRAQEYVITNRRVLKVEGLLDKRSADSSLEKINDAVLSQGVLGRILHYGDLDIMTASDAVIDRYQMLARAVDFKKNMLNAKNQLEDGGRGNVAPTASAASRGAGSDEVAAALDKLADLRDRGKITQADYEKKKAELLDRI